MRALAIGGPLAGTMIENSGSAYDGDSAAFLTQKCMEPFAPRIGAEEPPLFVEMEHAIYILRRFGVSEGKNDVRYYWFWVTPELSKSVHSIFEQLAAAYRPTLVTIKR